MVRASGLAHRARPESPRPQAGKTVLQCFRAGGGGASGWVNRNLWRQKVGSPEGGRRNPSSLEVAHTITLQSRGGQRDRGNNLSTSQTFDQSMVLLFKCFLLPPSD